MPGRLANEVARPNTRRQLEPRTEASGRRGPTEPGRHVSAKCRFQSPPPMLQGVPHRGDVAVKIVGAQTLRECALRNGGDERIEPVLGIGEESCVPRRRHDYPDAERWTDQLRKALEVNHDRSPVWRTKWRAQPPEGKITAEIVLDDRELKLAGDCQQLLPPLLRERRPGGVLE